IEPGALLDHRQTNAARTDDRNRLASNFVAKRRQVRMPEAPLVFASQVLGGPQLSRNRSQHEEGELRGRFGEDVGRVGEGDLVTVRFFTVDVVKTNRKL